MTALLPCPHCGSEPHKDPQRVSDYGQRLAVWCDGCQAMGPEGDTEAQAIAAWNRRSPTWEEIERDGAWKLVPVEPSASMLTAALEEWSANDYAGPEEEFSAIYRAMLAAAPVPSLNETLSTGGESDTGLSRSQPSADAGTHIPRSPLDPANWEVEVRIDGERVLTLGHDHLSGIENIDDYGDTVRACAEHLRAFIGSGEPVPCFACGDTGMERWVGHGGNEEVGPCSVCQGPPAVTIPDHKPDGSGLDDGPWIPGKGPRAKAAPKSKEALAAIRAKAWATRRSPNGASPAARSALPRDDQKQQTPPPNPRGDI